MVDESGGIDKYIPPKEVADLPIPPMTERIVQKNIIEPTLQDLIETTLIAAEVSPDASRLILKYIQKGEKLSGMFEEEIEQFKREGQSDSKQAALACDVEVGFLLKRADTVRKKLAKSLDDKKPDITLAQEAESLLQRLDNIRKGRPEDEPNQVTGFAKALGVDESLAIINPFGALEEKLAAAITDDLTRQKIISAVDKMGGPTKEIKDFLSHAKLQENVKRYGKKAAIAGGSVGLIVLLSGWFAMKMESGKRQ